MGVVFSKHQNNTLLKLLKTLREAAMEVLEQSKAISDAILSMTQKVNEQVIKQLDEFAKAHEAQKKHAWRKV